MGAAAYTGMPAETADHVEQLLRGVMSPETVAGVGDSGCMEAVRALTMRVCNTLGQGDAMSQRLTQQQILVFILTLSLEIQVAVSGAPEEQKGKVRTRRDRMRGTRARATRHCQHTRTHR